MNPLDIPKLPDRPATISTNILLDAQRVLSPYRVSIEQREDGKIALRSVSKNNVITTVSTAAELMEFIAGVELKCQH